MKCSGVVSNDHDPELDTEEVDIGLRRPTRLVAMCASCRDAAGRMGLIDRRLTHPTPHRPGLSPTRDLTHSHEGVHP